jgi:hypothetical protein
MRKVRSRGLVSNDRESDQYRRFSPPFGRSALFCVYRRARSGRTDSGHSRCDCDAEPKAARPSSPSRNGLLLGSCGRFRHDVGPRVLPMERGLSPVHFGASGVCRRDDRPDGEAKTLAVLAGHSHDRNGRALHPDDYSLLCGQRAKPAAVAGIAPLAFWILPTLIGAPILINTLLRHPLVKQMGGRNL